MQQGQSKTPTWQIWLPLLLATVLVCGVLIGMRIQSETPAVIIQEAGVEGDIGRGQIEELIRYVEAKYVDDIDREQLVEEAINSILQQLDPHSSYIPAEKLREVNEQLEGNFDGIGVEFMILDDTVLVVAPLAGGPSDAAGIRAGDMIISVEDSVIAGKELGNRDVINLLRGEKGTEVRIGVLRKPGQEIRNYTITRAEIPIHSVESAYMLDDKTGYIKVSRFTASTDQEFIAELERLVNEEDMQDLVIDLRHNPGGYLQKATNMLSQLFSAKGKLLVYYEGENVNLTEYKTSGRALFNVDDIVVIIDEGSASASEILAGAIQDHDRGIIVGRRSFGKGLVQEQYRLSDGSALRLTVARYFTPSGRSIQKPYDHHDYNEDFNTRYESGELLSPKHITIQDSTRFYTSSGRLVYGGGGIIPDVFVPLDTTELDTYFSDLRNLVAGFAFRYQTTSTEKLNAIPHDRFLRTLRNDEDLIDQFIAYVENNGLRIDEDRWSEYRPKIRHQIIAQLAKLQFGDPVFYEVMHQQDEMIQTALDVLRSSKPISEYQQTYK